MEQLEIEIIKKNRKYFSAKFVNKKYEFKILIDENSNHLELGFHCLMCEDISVRSKYGTDVIYKVKGEAVKDKIVSFSSDKYNEFLVAKCKQLGGKWDYENKVWIFNAFVEQEVDKLEELFNEDFVIVEIKAKEEIYETCAAISFMGYPLVEAKGRDEGVSLKKNVSLLCGNAKSGGSRTYYRTEIEKGTTFRLEVAKKLFDIYDEKDKWEINIIN